MRWKYKKAVEILTAIESTADKKTDTSWLNRSKIYGILKAKGYIYYNRNGKPRRWIEPINIPF